MRSLPLFHAIEGRMVVVLGNGAMAEPKRRLVERAGGVVATSIDEGAAQGARLCFIALDDDSDLDVALSKARAAGMLINVVDRPDLCEFTTPSILERDPVLIAIGTSGASAGLAKQLRLRLETLLPANLGALASKLAEIRPKLRQRFPKVIERRQAIDSALAMGGMLDPLAEGASDRVDDWLSGDVKKAEGGEVELLLSSADPEDLTLRQARLLGCADIILFESNVPQTILDRARADAKRIALPFKVSDPSKMVQASGLTLILRMA